MMKINMLFSQPHITRETSQENKNTIPEKREYPLKITRLDAEQLNPHPSFLSNPTVSKPKFLSKQSKLSKPAIVDLRPKLQSPYNQGNIGSCTANALCAAYQLLDKTIGTPSRLFLYYNERDLIVNSDEDTNEDSGAYLSDGIASLVQYGVCSETSWPYIESNFSVKPTSTCYTEALRHKVFQHNTIPNDLNIMKSVLQSGLPFVTGISIYDSFESISVAKTGMVPMPDQANENNLGGHAVLVCGYNDNIQWYQNKITISNTGAISIKQITSPKQKGVWIVRNSWGSNWGIKGYFYLPYPYLLDQNMASDQWVISSIKTQIQPKSKTAIGSNSLITFQKSSRKPTAQFANRFLSEHLVGGGCGCGH